MKRLFFTLLLTTITLSSQVNAMWFTNIARSAARSAAHRTLTARPTMPAFSRNLFQAQPVQMPRNLPLTRINPAQTSVLTQKIEPQKSLVQHPNFRSDWQQSQQKRFYSGFTQRLAECSEYSQSWYTYLFGVGAAATATAFGTDSDDNKITNFMIKGALERGGFTLTKYMIWKGYINKEQIANILIQNPNDLKALFKSRYALCYLDDITKGYINKERITNIIIQNPNTLKILLESKYALCYLDDLSKENPKTFEQFSSIIIQDQDSIKALLQTIKNLDYSDFIISSQIIHSTAERCIRLLNKLFSINPNLFINALLKNLDDFSEIFPMITYSGFNQVLYNKIKETCKTNDLENLEKYIFCMEASSSQTTQHLQHNVARTLVSRTVTAYMHNNRLNKLFHSAHEKEKKLQKEGHVTFVHGQKRDYYLPETLYTFLWELVNNKKTNNFIFAHVKQPAINPDQEKATLHQLRQNGRNTDDDRQRLLFMNYAFFANDAYHASNTAEYVKANDNFGSINLSFAEIFGYFGLHNISKKYKNKLDELQHKYKKLSPEGTLLLIGIPKKRVNECVYSALPLFGRKDPIHIDGIGKTDDTAKILETLRYHPEKIKDTDQLEFCLIMTENGGGLDPDTGIQVHPLIPCDNEEDLQKLEAERKALFEEIARDIQQQRKTTN